jgi:hypothetical protein
LAHHKGAIGASPDCAVKNENRCSVLLSLDYIPSLSDFGYQCLEATVNGPFFPEWEFGTIFGLERNEVRQVLLSWPDLDETDESVVRAINNSFNNLLGYPAKNKQELWSKFISVGGMELARIFDKWKGRAPRTSYKVRDHFDDAM